jgi:hypothetical protein
VRRHLPDLLERTRPAQQGAAACAVIEESVIGGSGPGGGGGGHHRCFPRLPAAGALRGEILAALAAAEPAWRDAVAVWQGNDDDDDDDDDDHDDASGLMRRVSASPMIVILTASEDTNNPSRAFLDATAQASRLAVMHLAHGVPAADVVVPLVVCMGTTRVQFGSVRVLEPSCPVVFPDGPVLDLSLPSESAAAAARMDRAVAMATWVRAQWTLDATEPGANVVMALDADTGVTGDDHEHQDACEPAAAAAAPDPVPRPLRVVDTNSTDGADPPAGVKGRVENANAGDPHHRAHARMPHRFRLVLQPPEHHQCRENLDAVFDALAAHSGARHFAILPLGVQRDRDQTMLVYENMAAFGYRTGRPGNTATDSCGTDAKNNAVNAADNNNVSNNTNAGRAPRTVKPRAKAGKPRAKAGKCSSNSTSAVHRSYRAAVSRAAAAIEAAGVVHPQLASCVLWRDNADWRARFGEARARNEQTPDTAHRERWRERIAIVEHELAHSDRAGDCRVSVRIFNWSTARLI